MKFSTFVFLLVNVVFGLELTTPGGQALRESAQGSQILIGSAVRPSQLSEALYTATLAREFNMVEPEDALKWEVVHPQRNEFDFSQADQILEFAVLHEMKLRGHTLVWHRQNPRWLTEGHYTSTELAHILKQHIKTVVGHYRGKIFAWDVVNEAFDELHPGVLRSTIWRDQPGIALGRNDSASMVEPRASGGAEPETHSSKQRSKQRSKQPYLYVERCFRWAHEADPRALLFYNEAEAETTNSKSDAVFSMVRDFRRRGVPIDGVGLQMHIPNLYADVASISANIKRLTGLGVQVQITEMDVALPLDSNGNARAQDLVRQGDIYRDVALACLSHPGCTAIQTWGFTDKYSWIGSHTKHRQGAALLFDQNYRAKHSYQALRDALNSARR